MLTRFRDPVRALLLAMALAFAVQAADARAETQQPQTTARTTARAKGDAPAADRDAFGLEGALIVAGIVVVVVALAWVASRIGDNH